MSFVVVVFLSVMIYLRPQWAVVSWSAWFTVSSRISLKQAQNILLQTTKKLSAYIVEYEYFQNLNLCSFLSIRTRVSLWSSISLLALETENIDGCWRPLCMHCALMYACVCL